MGAPGGAMARIGRAVLVALALAGPIPAIGQKHPVGSDVAAAIEGGDYQRALELLAPAVERGEAGARLAAGLICVHALDAPCPAERAVALLSDAARGGNADAQLALALAFLGGPGSVDEMHARVRAATEACERAAKPAGDAQ